VSGMDRAKSTAQDLVGKAKAAVGKATGDKSTENEGRSDQVKANLKDAGEKFKHAFKKHMPRHRVEPGDSPGITSDGPGSTSDGPKQ
jgi:uncharacterized protein YjbJ (UPF0337 family)